MASHPQASPDIPSDTVVHPVLYILANQYPINVRYKGLISKPLIFPFGDAHTEALSSLTINKLFNGAAE